MRWCSRCARRHRGRKGKKQASKFPSLAKADGGGSAIAPVGAGWFEIHVRPHFAPRAGDSHFPGPRSQVMAIEEGKRWARWQAGRRAESPAASSPPGSGLGWAADPSDRACSVSDDLARNSTSGSWRQTWNGHDHLRRPAWRQAEAVCLGEVKGAHRWAAISETNDSEPGAAADHQAARPSVSDKRPFTRSNTVKGLG